MFKNIRAYDCFNDVFYYSHQSASMSKFYERCESYIEGGNNLIYEAGTEIKDNYDTEVYVGDVVIVSSTIWNEKMTVEFKNGGIVFVSNKEESPSISMMSMDSLVRLGCTICIKGNIHKE